MQGKTVLITGANSGIGKVAASALAGMGATVVLACRRPDAAQQAMADIRREHPQAQLDFVAIDLASLASVRRAAAEVMAKYPVVDVLINNAGLANMQRQTSEDGFEMTFAVNHLGPFLFTNLLLPALRAGKGRVVTVASGAHKAGRMHWADLQLSRGYFVLRSYAQSKLANILFTKALAARVEADGIHANCLHPGAVSTSIWPERNWVEKAFSKVLRLFLISAEKGARTSIWLASGDVGGKASGSYFENCREKTPSRAARDSQAAEKLWEISANLTGLK
ncbi:SDR family oxidoreductase [Alcanivorax sp. 1008]|uniref:SDR family oxidoreductase n=1 Tax=Alcanivorax sp. 1008 TaxID=2816853 RepID=UPI001DAE0BAF|nr:SDR family oxidoreductase [Alcanivorax sp. 1008]MCC1496953.1 SDR family oxidoreductase [Alcanivorax sp. 1008]